MTVNKDEIQQHYYDDAKLDELCAEFVKKPTSEEDERIKRIIMTLIADLRNSRVSDDAKEETIRQLEKKNARYVQVFENVKTEIDKFGELVGIDVDSTSLEEKARAFNEKVRQQAEEIERVKAEAFERIDTLLKQNAQQAEEIERLQRGMLHCWDRMNKLEEFHREREEARKAAERDNTALLECLAWYADDVNWIGVTRCAAIINVDGGEKARTLLAELDRKDTQPTRDDTCGVCWTRGPHRRVGDGWECVKCNPVEDTQPKEVESNE